MIFVPNLRYSFLGNKQNVCLLTCLCESSTAFIKTMRSIWVHLDFEEDPRRMRGVGKREACVQRPAEVCSFILCTFLPQICSKYWVCLKFLSCFSFIKIDLESADWSFWHDLIRNALHLWYLQRMQGTLCLFVFHGSWLWENLRATGQI